MGKDSANVSVSGTGSTASDDVKEPLESAADNMKPPAQAVIMHRLDDLPLHLVKTSTRPNVTPNRLRLEPSPTKQFLRQQTGRKSGEGAGLMGGEKRRSVTGSGKAKENESIKGENNRAQTKKGTSVNSDVATDVGSGSGEDEHDTDNNDDEDDDDDDNDDDDDDEEEEEEDDHHDDTPIRLIDDDEILPIGNPVVNPKQKDKLLALQGPQLYPAVVLDTKTVAAAVKVKIHYAGWHKRFDEWLAIESLVALDDQGLALQDYLKRKVLQQLEDSKPKPNPKPPKKEKPKKKKKINIKPPKPPKTTKRSLGEGAQPKEKRAKKEPPSPSEEEVVEKEIVEPKPLVVPRFVQTEKQYFSGVPEVKMSFVEELKVKMVTDWTNITKKKLLLKLPRTCSVTKILQGFCEHSVAKAWSSALVASDFTAVLKEKFREMFENSLLYPQEVKQFVALGASDVCDVYGAEHLLRCFSQLPIALAQSNLNKSQMENQLKCVGELSRYICLKQDQFFSNDAYAKM